MPGRNTLEAVVGEAVALGQVPYLVGMIGNCSGTLWSGAAGFRASGQAASTDAVFRIASMSKAIGSTAALILADRGRLDWDMPVEEVLPEFGSLRVLESFDAAPRMRPPRVRATIRQLATHTSGLAYEFWDANIGRFLRESGTPSVVSGLRAGLSYPLAFEPGERWQYGGGLDWLGLVISAIDGRSIDCFCIEEIFEPLKMTDTCFALAEGQRDRLGDVFARSEGGAFLPASRTLDPPAQPEFVGMGHALYSTAPDYLRFLRMCLGKGQLEGVRLLSEATVADALRNHIGSLRLEARASTFPPVTADFDPLPGVEKSHSLVCARVEQSVPNARAAGSQFWGGVHNTQYWFDPASDLAGVFMTQCTPFLDGSVMEAYAAFERAAYASVGKT
jgi:methyl acetate hydrolase